MRKDLISLYELQLHVKSWGNSNNERVRTFLKEVFKIGFTNQVSDIFPMNDFLYGDFLILDKEFLYKECLEFLKDNQEIDDVLYYIAENNFEKFKSLCLPSLMNIDDIKKIFNTKKQTSEEDSFSIEDFSSIQMQHISPYTAEPLSDSDLSDYLAILANPPEIPAFIKRVPKDIEPEQLKITDIHTDILEKMGLKTNSDLKYNIYARMRIEDYVNDIKMLRGKLGNIFTS